MARLAAVDAFLASFADKRTDLRTWPGSMREQAQTTLVISRQGRYSAAHDPTSAILVSVSPARILVVDDEPHMRSALQRVFTLAGYRVEVYESGSQLLQNADLQRSGCILLDMLMPGMNGLDVQRELIDRKCPLPLVFLTGSAEVRSAVAAMRAGATDFLEKPFDNADLLQRVGDALAAYQREQAMHEDAREIAERFKRLSPRETEVIGKVAAGLTNKEIARELGTSHRTVEIQRAHIMERMQADSLADLIRMYLALQAVNP